MTDQQLEKINAERRRRGLPALTRQQAQEACVNANVPYHEDSSNFLWGFMLGAALSDNSPATRSPADDGGFQGGGGGNFGGGGADSSYDTSSSDSSSSSSSDSGSSSSD